MFARLISTLSRWIGQETEQAIYTSIKAGAQRGAHRAFLELTEGQVDAADHLDTDHSAQPDHLEREPSNPLTRTEVHNMKRDDLIKLVNERGLDIDLGQSVKEIKAEVIQQFGL